MASYKLELGINVKKFCPKKKPERKKEIMHFSSTFFLFDVDADEPQYISIRKWVTFTKLIDKPNNGNNVSSK